MYSFIKLMRRFRKLGIPQEKLYSEMCYEIEFYMNSCPFHDEVPQSILDKL
jgi:hypothetical protein